MLKLNDIQIGKIFFKYNEEKEEFEKVRLLSIEENNNNEKIKFILYKMKPGYFKVPESKDIFELTKDEFVEFRKEYDTTLQSDGSIFISDVIAISRPTDGAEIHDVMIMYLNNTESGELSLNRPSVLARQALNDPYAVSVGIENKAGFCVNSDILPDGYELKDLMYLEKLIDPFMFQVYKMDNINSILYILNYNYEYNSNKVFKKLYDDILDHKIIAGVYTDKLTAPKVIDGYCINLDTFFVNENIMYEINNVMGIAQVDFEIEPGSISLTEEQKNQVYSLYNGLKMYNTLVCPFDYDIDFSKAKMPYILLRDSKDVLYVVAYTISEDEIIKPDPKVIKDNSKEFNDKILKITNAYFDDDKKY